MKRYVVNFVILCVAFICISPILTLHSIEKLPFGVFLKSPNGGEKYIAGAKVWDTSNSRFTIISDPWSMFRHDLLHTGFSSTTLPDMMVEAWVNSTTNQFSSPAIVDGKIYVGIVDPTGGFNGGVACIDLKTGKSVWKDVAKLPNSVYSSPAVVDGKVYVGCDNGKVYCLDAATGAQIWETQSTMSKVRGSPAVVTDKVYITSGSDDSAGVAKLFCFNSVNGSKIWEFDTQGRTIISSPAIYKNKVYLGGFDKTNGKIYMINASDGTLIKDYTIPGHSVESSPAIEYGRVYVCANDGGVYCLDASNLIQIWKFQVPGFNPSIEKLFSSPAVAYNYVYILSNHSIHCLDARATGSTTQIWARNIRYQTTTKDKILTSPAVADNKVYTTFENISCFNATTGALLWTKYLGGQPTSASPSIAEGCVVVNSPTGLYCYGYPSGKPYVSLIEPHEGVNWTSGTKQQIKWDASGGTQPLKITLEYKTSQSSVYNPIDKDLPNTGSYEWCVPPACSTDCYVRITATDSSNPPLEAINESKRFIIWLPPLQLKITSPTTTTNISGGDPLAISWEVAGTTGKSYINIKFKKNISSPYDIIATHVNITPPTYVWKNTPYIQSTDCFINVTLIDEGPPPRHVSGEVRFTIWTKRPVVMIESPKEGDVWTAGVEYKIKWRAEGGVGTLRIKLEYKSTVTGMYTLIADDETNDGVYEWRTPMISSNNCFVKVTAKDTVGGVGCKESGRFAIRPSEIPVVTILSPKKGYNWTGGNQYEIKWDVYGGEPPLVIKLEYKIKKDKGYIKIADRDAVPTKYLWTVPTNVRSNDCYIKATVVDVAGKNSSDEVGPFIIWSTTVISGSIYGIVKDSKNNLPIQGATVRITGPIPGPKILSTNTSGEFFFTDLPLGIYEINVTHREYESQIKSVNLSLEQPTVTVSFMLIRKTPPWENPLLIYTGIALICVIISLIVVSKILGMAKEKKKKETTFAAPTTPPPSQVATVLRPQYVPIQQPVYYEPPVEYVEGSVGYVEGEGPVEYVEGEGPVEYVEGEGPVEYVEQPLVEEPAQYAEQPAEEPVEYVEKPTVIRPREIPTEKKEIGLEVREAKKPLGPIICPLCKRKNAPTNTVCIICGTKLQ